ncbi:hypothetical protein C4D60_Mb07t11200 [Musa balbisiana]|uniref:Bacterial Ig-like domain-containing protein n=1 Tax=Musa balbisiana TaxID=52838 RepID=A0A4S8JH10_MUSBA|nr:hypothetical protein C4D60_Mb07t11200 [Musa balbisiana]
MSASSRQKLSIHRELVSLALEPQKNSVFGGIYEASQLTYSTLPPNPSSSGLAFLGASEMGWSRRVLCVCGFSWIVSALLLMPREAHAGVGSDAAVRFSEAPPAFSASSRATFRFEVTERRNDGACRSCSVTCKLDNYSSSACEPKEVTYSGLLEGDHLFEVCISDTISPTALISAASSFTNALNVSVNVSFSEPCTNGGGFKCSSSKCNLLVYGAGHVLPSTLKVLLPDRVFTLMVGISADVQFGRLVLVMDKGFCMDSAGNSFKRTSNSSFILHFAIRISGGYILSFHKITMSIYIIEINGNDSLISVEVPENKTVDIAGNKNLRSNILQLKHYTSPTISSFVSLVATSAFAMTSMVAALLTVSTSSLLSSGAVSRQKAYLVSEPSRNLLRILCHIQVFALCRWLVVNMPIEYYEFSRGIEWSIPYIHLPWEMGSKTFFEGSTSTSATHSEVWDRNKLYFKSSSVRNQILEMNYSEYGKPLNPGEYMSFLENQNMKPEAEFIMISRNSDRTSTGIVVGTVLLGVSTSFLISLLLILSLGISMGKLLQYKEVHQEGEKLRWYQEFVHVALGPGKRGQWAWKGQQSSINQTILGPLFEDLRGPPRCMLTQIAGRGNQGKYEDRIIASGDETEDAEAPFIQKLFGMLRIYYTLLESVKCVSLGVLAGAYSSKRPSRTPTLIILSITCFQLFFLVLEKPFIKRKVQFVEIISVAGEVGLLGACLAVLEKDFFGANERRLGLFMLAMFIIMFTAQLANEWYALYQQVIRLSRTRDSFSSGLKRALGGILLIVLPTTRVLTEMVEQSSSSHGEGESGSTVSPTGQVQGASGTNERSWLRQLRELAEASFGREDAGAPNDPSSSTNQRSEFQNAKRSGSSSVASSSGLKSKADLKAKSRGLYKDLESIFSSK